MNVFVCESCDGLGEETCHFCSGNGSISGQTCPLCEGSAKETCHTCWGSGGDDFTDNDVPIRRSRNYLDEDRV